IMGEKMELHPLAAIFGVLAGGEIGGGLGGYLSIPVMASLRIGFRRWRVYAEKRRVGPLNEYALGTELAPRKYVPIPCSDRSFRPEFCSTIPSHPTAENRALFKSATVQPASKPSAIVATKLPS